ncbi:MAG: hypothetical protein Q8Q12_12350 [bacterium]|nr:hypothetical protein [bacterium]
MANEMERAGALISFGHVANEIVFALGEVLRTGRKLDDTDQTCETIITILRSSRPWSPLADSAEGPDFLFGADGFHAMALAASQCPDPKDLEEAVRFWRCLEDGAVRLKDSSNTDPTLHQPIHQLQDFFERVADACLAEISLSLEHAGTAEHEPHAL